MKNSLLFVAAAAIALTIRPHAPTAAVAAPRIIMFYGGVLEGRRYMTTIEENMRFMGAIADPATITRDGVAQRPFVEVALYWHNPTWAPYAADTALLKALRPELAQPARFYLGEAQHLPVFDYYSAHSDPGFRTVTPAGLEILKRHDVPVRTDRNRKQ